MIFHTILCYAIYISRNLLATCIRMTMYILKNRYLYPR